ncbi:MAG: zinc ribbon domain-containing protein [Clostridiales bacterium]|nr:zinc ribbon domain-containing protein [Clostridiales bacterium]
MADNNFCSRCGAHIESGAERCSYCGSYRKDSEDKTDEKRSGVAKTKHDVSDYNEVYNINSYNTEKNSDFDYNYHYKSEKRKKVKIAPIVFSVIALAIMIVLLVKYC